MKITIQSEAPDPAAYMDQGLVVLADVTVEFDDGHVIAFTAEPSSLLDLNPDGPFFPETDFEPGVLGAFSCREGGSFQISFHRLRNVEMRSPTAPVADHG